MNLPLNIDWQQILLHLLNFVILFGVLYFLLYSPVKNFMDKREEHYKNMDEEAKKNLLEAENSKNEYAKKLEDVKAEIEEKKQKAYHEIEAQSEESILSAKQEAERIISEARKRAQGESEKIIEGAQSEIAQMVADATEKIMLQSSTSESYDQFLDAAERGGEDE